MVVVSGISLSLSKYRFLVSGICFDQESVIEGPIEEEEDVVLKRGK